MGKNIMVFMLGMLLVSLATAQPQYNIGSQASSGVSKIIAGSNISISPVSGTGEVTISASGGSSGGGNPFDQNLNTTDNVQFINITGQTITANTSLVNPRTNQFINCGAYSISANFWGCAFTRSRDDPINNSNYYLISDGSNFYFNYPTGGSWSLRKNNADRIAISSTDNLNFYVNNVSLGATVSKDKLLMYASGNTKYGLGIQSGRLDIFAPTGNEFYFTTRSTSDGQTNTDRAKIDTNGNFNILGASKLIVDTSSGVGSATPYKATQFGGGGTFSGTNDAGYKVCTDWSGRTWQMGGDAGFGSTAGASLCMEKTKTWNVASSPNITADFIIYMPNGTATTTVNATLQPVMNLSSAKKQATFNYDIISNKNATFGNLSSNGGLGITRTIQVGNASNTGNCSLIFVGGLYTGGSC